MNCDFRPGVILGLENALLSFADGLAENCAIFVLALSSQPHSSKIIENTWKDRESLLV